MSAMPIRDRYSGYGIEIISVVTSMERITGASSLIEGIAEVCRLMSVYHADIYGC